MHINNLLLSVAVPAASKAIDVAAGAAHSLGQSFSQFLSDTVAKHDATSLDEASIEEGLAIHADVLRDFLASNAITEGFRIRFEKSDTGEIAAGVSGPNADTVAGLLEQRPQWMRELQRIASAAQAAFPSSQSGRPPHLNIEITEHGTSHWFRG